MSHTIKMLLQGRKQQRSFKIISCPSKLISSKTQINLGYISLNDFNMNWDKFWSQIQNGAKVNKNLRVRLYNLSKNENISDLHKQNILKITNNHCLSNV